MGVSIVGGAVSGAAAPSGKVQGPAKGKIVIAKPDFLRSTNVELVHPIKEIR